MESVARVSVSASELSPRPHACPSGFDRGRRATATDDLIGLDDRAGRGKFVREIQRARRRRESFFDGELFADPAWDMLLELYASHLEQRRIAVSSLCIASHVPATTALRWITKLEQDGLVIRRADPSDGRRSWIELTAEGLHRMSSYFDVKPAILSSLA